MPDFFTVLKDLGMAKMLRCRIRYFTDGAVIGSKEFVNEAFASATNRFGPKCNPSEAISPGFTRVGHSVAAEAATAAEQVHRSQS